MFEEVSPRPHRLYFKTSDGNLHAVEATPDIADVSDQKAVRRTISSHTRMTPDGAVLKVIK